MNKLLFLVITSVALMALMYMSQYTAASYLLSDYYVADETVTYDDETLSEAMPLDEYLTMLKNGEDPGIETIEQLPYEIQVIQAKAFMAKWLVFIIVVILSIFAGFVVKNNRIEFNVMSLDNSERAINIIRISLYVIVLTAAYMTSQTYPAKFLLGWSLPLLWTVTLLAMMIWVLNIAYAIKENKRVKGKTLKPARK